MLCLSVCLSVCRFFEELVVLVPVVHSNYVYACMGAVGFLFWADRRHFFASPHLTDHDKMEIFSAAAAVYSSILLAQ